MVAPQGTVVETGVQVYPSTVNGDVDAAYWLPSYFTQWYGPSLVLPDEVAASLDASGALADPGSYSDTRIKNNPKQTGHQYEAVLSVDAELKYGEDYEFRVRLGDLAGGGPREDEHERNEAPSSIAPWTFRRYVAPKQLTVKPLDPQDNEDAGAVQFYQGTHFIDCQTAAGVSALLFTELDTATAIQAAGRSDVSAPGGSGRLARRSVNIATSATSIRTSTRCSWSSTSRHCCSTRKRPPPGEPYLRLYTTTRPFDPDLETPFELTIEYVNVPVIDFNDAESHGDPQLAQAAIDAGGDIVLPQSRDIRITLYPVCSDKPGKPAYFGFDKTRPDIALSCGRAHRVLRPRGRHDRGGVLQFGLPSESCAALSATRSAAGEQPLHHRRHRRRGQGASAEAGHRAAGRGARRRGERADAHRTAGRTHSVRVQQPDSSYAGAGPLIAHLCHGRGAPQSLACVLSFDVHRDWTWDGLADTGITVERTRAFTGEPGTLRDRNGRLPDEWESRRAGGDDRRQARLTRMVFIDAIEPKKDLAQIAANVTTPFPNTIDVSYTLTAAFIDAWRRRGLGRRGHDAELQLPVTTIPTQVPKIVAAGYALSPYRRNHDYSETAVRERFLWFEFDAPIQDPNDTYFARVLAYAPDPLLVFPNGDQLQVRQDDPPLAIAPN